MHAAAAMTRNPSIFVLFFAACLVQSQRTDWRCYEFNRGECNPANGKSLIMPNVKSLDECSKACDDTPGCALFLYPDPSTFKTFCQLWTGVTLQEYDDSCQTRNGPDLPEVENVNNGIECNKQDDLCLVSTNR